MFVDVMHLLSLIDVDIFVLSGYCPDIPVQILGILVDLIAANDLKIAIFYKLQFILWREHRALIDGPIWLYKWAAGRLLADITLAYGKWVPIVLKDS